MFPLTLTINTAAELNAVMAALGVKPSAQAELPLTGVAAQHAAVDETAGIVEQPAKKPAGAKRATDPAPGPTTAEAAGAAAPEKTVAESAPAAASAASDAPASTAATDVDYPTLQKAVFALAGKSRTAAAEVVASFNVKTFKDLEPAQWGKALAAVNAKLAEV